MAWRGWSFGFAVWLLWGAISSFAATLYIAPNGSDNNSVAGNSILREFFIFPTRYRLGFRSDFSDSDCRDLRLRNWSELGLLCGVSKLRLFAKYWLPVVIWSVVIYSASGDQKSVRHSSRIIEPLLRWLVPDISDEAVRATVLVARKGAHMTEYAIFTLLLWRGFRGTVWRTALDWSWRCAFAAWGGAVIYAVTDEWHQVFVPGRQGSPWDVLIDSIGAAAGLVVLRWLLLRREKLAKSNVT